MKTEVESTQVESKLEVTAPAGPVKIKDAINYMKTRPQPKRIWSGIIEGSLGIIFGPPKSGKSIFCENLCINLILGSETFMSLEIPNQIERVLLINLEESFNHKLIRNDKQLSALSTEERNLVEERWYVQDADFKRTIKTEEAWKDLKQLIRDSGAKVVVIDSISRMIDGKPEDSSTMSALMLRLRLLREELEITLICIHHTRKIGDEPVIMDHIKGSSVISQELDFAIAIKATKLKDRYMKFVFFRYDMDDEEFVREFNLNDSLIVEYEDECKEQEIINRNDKRRDNTSRDGIIDHFKKNCTQEFSTAELVNTFKKNLNIGERQIKEYLKTLTAPNGPLERIRKGYYKYRKISKEVSTMNNDTPIEKTEETDKEEEDE